MRRAALIAAAALLLTRCGDGSGPDAEPAVGPGVTAGAPVAQAPTAPDTAAPVAIRGRVVEAGSGRGVGGAYVIVLQPGVTLAQWEASGADAEALMAAATVADSSGVYAIAELARRASYTVMVAADGYESAIFENGLAVAAGDEGVLDMDAIELMPR
ncbi:MAG: carboxypeptidase-like regulatory domain-containing protein [Gemmatimonadota bacterium]